MTTLTVQELAAKLDSVEKARDRAAIKREFMSAYGVSSSTISRILCEVGFRSHNRSDLGCRKKHVDDAALRAMAAMQRASLSLRKGVVMPAADAVEIAIDSGLVAAGEVSEAYLNRWLREQSASRLDQAEAEPHVTLRSLGPNHVHQADFSLAVNWKIFQGKPVYEHMIYKNKLPTAGTPRLWRLLIVDHSSGAVFPYYSQNTGETVQATLEGLYYAWAEKQLDGVSIRQKFPFRGVPRILMLDRGSANQAKITATVLERLNVRLIICEGARSKGTVETSHNWWESHFESRFRLQTANSVEQLNHWAMDFAAKLNATNEHSRHGMSRSALWSWHIGRREETLLRELRCDFQTFRAIAISDPQKCLVRGNYTVRFRSQTYRVPTSINESHVYVQYSPFEFPNVLLKDSLTSPTSWLAEPVVMDEFGFPADAPVIGEEFRAHKQTATAVFIKQADEQSKEFIASQKLAVFGHHLAKLEDIEVKPPSCDVLATNVPAEVQMSKVQARLLVAQAIGRDFTSPEVTYMNDVFCDAVTRTQVEAVIVEIVNGITARVLSFPKVSGGQA